jgi:hypothetical protein
MRAETDIRQEQAQQQIRQAQIRQAQIRKALRAWVLSKAKDLDESSLSDTTPLFEERRLRSLHLPELLLLLERLRGQMIDVDDLRPGDFRDIDTLVTRFCGTEVAS